MIDPHIELDEQDNVHPVNLSWYRDEDGYVWPTPAEGRILVDPSESNPDTD